MERLERRHEPIRAVSTRRLSLSILKNIDETQEVQGLGDIRDTGQVLFVLYDVSFFNILYLSMMVEIV